MLSCDHWRIQKFWKGGGKTIYQLRPHLSQMRTMKYMPLTRKKRLFDKKCEPIGGAATPTAPPFESATGCDQRWEPLKQNTIAYTIRWWVVWVLSVCCIFVLRVCNVNRTKNEKEMLYSLPVIMYVAASRFYMILVLTIGGSEMFGLWCDNR